MNKAAFYQPVPRGFEKKIQERLDYWSNLRAQKQDL